MIIPPYLASGDTVAIVSPAKIIIETEIAHAVQLLEQSGLKVLIGPHVHAQWNRFAGTDVQRQEDLQWAIDHPEVKAIFFARGGYGSVRIIDRVNFEPLKRNPKWLIGYSDITVFHCHLPQQYELATCHATMPLNMIDRELNQRSSQALIQLLSGQTAAITCPPHTFNRTGIAHGELVGGNLSVFCSLIGTDSGLSTTNKILFIEDLCEELYHLDRMMYQLKKSGSLDTLKGLVIGGFTDMTDVSGWFEGDAYSIIQSHIEPYDFPVCFGFPAGHIDLNLPLIIGGAYQLTINTDTTVLEFQP